MNTGITLTCTWGRAPLVASKVPQVAYLLIEAQAAAIAEKMPLNFCLVLDRSGSMQGAKLAALKDAVKRVIETLTPQDIVAIVLFDDTVQTLVPATFATDKATLIAQVDAIEEAGGTAMSGGMAAGIVELRKNHDPGRVGAMLLLTDGQTWGDEERCRALARNSPVTGCGSRLWVSALNGTKRCSTTLPKRPAAFRITSPIRRRSRRSFSMQSAQHRERLPASHVCCCVWCVTLRRARFIAPVL